MKSEIFMILLGVILIIVGISLFRYYYKNSYSEDPKPVETETKLGLLILSGLVIIIFSIVSWINKL